MTKIDDNKLNSIQNVVNATRYDKNKERFVSNLYWNLKAAGFDVCILNDKYLIIDGIDFQFINSKKNYTYTAKQMGL